MIRSVVPNCVRDISEHRPVYGLILSFIPGIVFAFRVARLNRKIVFIVLITNSYGLDIIAWSKTKQ